MTGTLVTVAIIVAIIFLATQKKQNKGRNFRYKPEETWPFIERRLQTKSEEQLYQRLKKALPEHQIFVQVQASRVIDVKKGNDYQKWFNRINRMSLDYVVCDATLKTVAVIELDDPSHKEKSRQEADAKKDKAMQSAGIRMIRWTKTPSIEEIRAQLTATSKSVENTAIDSGKKWSPTRAKP